jgi:outer membrane protein TolC
MRSFEFIVFLVLGALWLLGGGIVPARAALPPLTLEQAVEQAHEKSPQLARARAAASEASWKPLEAISGNLPRLSASATHLFDVKYQFVDINLGSPLSIPSVFPKTTLSLDATWTIFDGLTSINAYRAALDLRDAARLEEERAELQVDSSTRLAFYKALSAQQLADVAAQNVKTLQEHSERVGVLLKQGKGTKYDSLRVEVQLSEALPEELASRDNVLLSRQALATEMGLPSDDRPIQGSLPEPDDKRLPEVLVPEPQSRADIQALVHRARASGRAQSASIGALLPKLSLVGQKLFYNNVDYEISDTSHYRDAYSLGVALTWNLFDGGASIARQRASVYQHDQAEAGADAALLRAPQDLELWKRRYHYNVALYRARKQAIVAAQESVRLAKLGNQAGTRTNTDVLDSELDLFRSRAGAVRAQLDAAEALINLELTLGRKLQ